mmetsp:Transcript_28276/g.83287  ORF Transcript_28276/g.83287 Transcript_28276/m.83287 type:complete len:326 (-) Transcript_28276:605-1582(-)
MQNVGRQPLQEEEHKVLARRPARKHLSRVLRLARRVAGRSVVLVAVVGGALRHAARNQSPLAERHLRVAAPLRENGAVGQARALVLQAAVLLALAGHAVVAQLHRVRVVARQLSRRIRHGGALAAEEEGEEVVLRLHVAEALLLADAALAAARRLVEPLRHVAAPHVKEDVVLRVDGVGALVHLWVDHARANALLEEGDRHRTVPGARHEGLVLGRLDEALTELLARAGQRALLVHLEANAAVGARLGVKSVDPLAAGPLVRVVAAYLRVVRPLLEQGRLVVGRIAPLLARDQQQRAANLDLVRRLRVHLCAHVKQLPEGGVTHA